MVILRNIYDNYAFVLHSSCVNHSWFNVCRLFIAILEHILKRFSLEGDEGVSSACNSVLDLTEVHVRGPASSFPKLHLISRVERKVATIADTLMSSQRVQWFLEPPEMEISRLASKGWGICNMKAIVVRRMYGYLANLTRISLRQWQSRRQKFPFRDFMIGGRRMVCSKAPSHSVPLIAR